MRVIVLLFASYADQLGAPSLELDVAPGATVADVVADVRGRPGASVLPASPLVAVNERYATPATQVQAGDEVALIPPVAGG